MKLAFEKIIFFDIGGVLLTNGWGHESRQAAAKKFGYAYDESNYLHEFIFNVYEIGSITLDEYLDRTVFFEPRNFSKEEYKDFMFAQSVMLPGMYDWLVEWKRKNASRFRIIAINNEGKELNDYRIKKFHLHQCFDAFISSCEVGMRKPDPGIYQLALGIAQVHPKQCLYFDDRQILVNAAALAGIPSYQHKDVDMTRKILEDL